MQPQLVEEIRRRAGVSLYHQYSSDAFLDHANKYLSTNVDSDVIEKIRDIASLQFPSNSDDVESFHTLEAVFGWINEKFPGHSGIEHGDRDGQLIIINDEKPNICVQTILSDETSGPEEFSQFTQKVLGRLPSGCTAPVELVLILSNPYTAFEMCSLIRSSPELLPDGLNVTGARETTSFLEGRDNWKLQEFISANRSVQLVRKAAKDILGLE